MTFEPYEFDLPEFWASAIINGDETGMSDAESAQLERFMTWMERFMQGRLGVTPSGHWAIEDTDETYFRPHHDATQFGVGACNCYKYLWMQQVKETTHE